MPDDIRPQLEDVGAVLRARTRSDTTGGETGTFDTSTRPTGAEVNEYIDQATAEIRLRLPADVPADLEPYVKRMIALRAAMFVELSYDPDSGEGSAYSRLETLFDSGMTALLSSLDDRGDDTTTAGRLVSATVVSPYSGPSRVEDPLL